MSLTQNSKILLSDINTALGAKAPLASPSLTGTPTAPTASTSTNTTQIATTAFVQSVVNNKMSNPQHISNRDSGSRYYKLGTMVTDDSGNYGNITINGRIGGWEQSNSAYFEIMMLNRSSARDGNTITATVSAAGNVGEALYRCDIVIYKQEDTSNIVYLKTNGYWLYDFDWSVYQHSITYDGTYITTTPTGTLIWTLTDAPKTTLDASGNFSATGKINGYSLEDFVTKINPSGSGIISFGRLANSTIGDKSIVLGINSKATNTNSIAIGTESTASGENSVVIGTGSTTTGLKSTAIGEHNTAAGEYALATGCWTTSSGIASTTLGNASTTGANSWCAMSSGILTTAKGLAQHVLGSYNVPDADVESYSTPAEHLLIIGNGDGLSSTKKQSNAATIDWQGNAWFSGDVYVGSTSGTNKDEGSVQLARKATSLSGYGITDAYTKSQINSSCLKSTRGDLNVDTLYDAGIHMVSSGTNLPDGQGDNYGVCLTLPYRQMTGNKKPDFGAQILIPNGDDGAKPNSLFYRTALAETWNPWQEVATKADLSSVSVSSAPKLTTSRTIAISGGATGTATSFDGSANITIPVTALDMAKASAGTLAVGRGGTGVTSNPSMLINLASTSAASVFTASPRPGVTGVLPVANGGTGSSSKNFVDLSSTQSIAGTKTFTGTIVTKGHHAEVVALSGTSIDVSTASCFTKSISANTSFTITGVTSSKSACFTLILTNGGSKTVTFPTSVKWADGELPELTSSGVDILTFITVNGGTTWYATPSIINAQ